LKISMDDDFIIETLKRIVSINTENPPGNEKILAEFIKGIFNKLINK
jgi:acetylornithine deacetylase/succinyl-diaminopimelate desuccinylase-like protein